MTIRLNPSNLAQTRSDLGLVLGTSANNVVQLDGSAKLPAVDGSALTNLPASGAWTLLSVSTASNSASVEIGTPASSPFTDTHETYMIVGFKMAVRTDTSAIRMQVGKDNGSGGITYSTANYQWSNMQPQSNTTNYLASASSSDSAIQIGSGYGPISSDSFGNGPREAGHFVIYLSNMNTANVGTTGGGETIVHGTFMRFNTFSAGGAMTGVAKNTSTATGFIGCKFFANSGNFDGKISVYGLKKAV